jgi:hypothetical protein
MAQVRKGDRVRAFLNANICGIVESINYQPTHDALMVGGVPPVVAIAVVKLDDGRIQNVKTTELYVEEVKRSR